MCINYLIRYFSIGCQRSTNFDGLFFVNPFRNISALAISGKFISEAVKNTHLAAGTERDDLNGMIEIMYGLDYYFACMMIITDVAHLVHNCIGGE